MSATSGRLRAAATMYAWLSPLLCAAAAEIEGLERELGRGLAAQAGAPKGGDAAEAEASTVRDATRAGVDPAGLLSID